MNLTDYGKFVRKLRIETEQSTKNMADALDVTPAYLSALETGKKKIPAPFLQNVIAFFCRFGLNYNDLSKELEEVAFRSQKTFELSPEQKDRELVAAFARKFPNMEEEQKMKMIEILKDIQ